MGILALELAPDGQAHILTTAGQLFTHSGTQWSKIATPEKFTALCFDSDSRLWAASRTSSIFFREDDEWRQMDLRIQQGPVTVHDLHMDRSGSLWVVGHPGILRVPAESLFDRSIRRLGTSEGVVPFGKEDGLGSTVATLGGSSISEDDSGWLWLATVGGLARTSLKRFSDSALDRPSPLAHIEAAKIDEEEADQSPPLRIPITASHFEIAFTGTLLGKPEKSRFRYRLGGPEDPWVGADKQRRASFLRPAAGSYTFEVQAIGSDGVVGPLTASLPVIVEPFWWERVSIQFGMLVLLLGIVVIVARWRIQLIQAHSNLQERFSRDLIESQEEERKRIAQDLHDSLGQELLVLNAHTEKAALEHADIADEMQSQSHRILAAIEETRRIAYGLRPPHLEMIGLGPLLEALAEDIETSSGIQVISDIADLDPRLPPEHEINLYRIAQEALGNAVKYSNASEIRLVLQKTPNGIELSIRDDGSGFSRTPRQPSASLGLTGMEQRSRFLGGSFNCQTAKGKGTQITVRIPVR